MNENENHMNQVSESGNADNGLSAGTATAESGAVGGVVQQAAENPTAPEKTYSQDEVNAIVGKKLARREAKLRKEYDRTYGNLVDTLKAGTGKETLEDITDTFREFYSQKGIELSQKPRYSDRDIEVLAEAEANDIISGGIDEVSEEVDRLAGIGLERMDQKEKAVFKKLAEYRANAERDGELEKIGVSKELYQSREFKDFASKFNPKTPMREIYDIYAKTLPQKDIKPAGSMKSNVTGDTGVKEFYSRDEALKFTRQDFDKNPKLFEAVERSMLKW